MAFDNGVLEAVFCESVVDLILYNSQDMWVTIEGGKILGWYDVSGDGLHGSADDGRSLGYLKGGALANDVPGMTDRNYLLPAR